MSVTHMVRTAVTFNLLLSKPTQSVLECKSEKINLKV